MRPLLTAILCTLMLFISAVLVINWQLWYSARATVITAARQSVERTTGILNEARLAAVAVSGTLYARCTVFTQP